MLELDYWTLRKPAFQQAMRKVLDHGGYGDVKTSYNISRLGSLVDVEIRASDDIFKKLMREYMVFEKGVPKRNERGEWVLKDEKKRKEYEEKFEDFMSHTVKIKRSLHLPTQ